VCGLYGVLAVRGAGWLGVGVGVCFVKGMHFSQSKNARLLNLFHCVLFIGSTKTQY